MFSWPGDIVWFYCLKMKSNCGYLWITYKLYDVNLTTMWFQQDCHTSHTTLLFWNISFVNVIFILFSHQELFVVLWCQTCLLGALYNLLRYFVSRQNHKNCEFGITSINIASETTHQISQKNKNLMETQQQILRSHTDMYC